MRRRPKSSARAPKPIKAMIGFKWAILEGISASNSKGSVACAATPSATWIYLEMMMTPMEASIPYTAATGQNSPKVPSLRDPKRICRTPAATPTASAFS